MFGKIIGRGLWVALALALGMAGCDDGSDGSGGKGGTAGSGGGTASGGTGGMGGAGGGQGGTGGGQGGTGGAEVQLGDIDVTVQYAGMQTGTLSIAAFTSFPPMGPPLAAQSYDMPVFPQTGKLIGLETGKPYYVVAILDVGSNNPQSPGPEDLVSFTMMPVDIVANSAVPVELTLTDP